MQFSPFLSIALLKKNALYTIIEKKKNHRIQQIF